MTTLAAQRGSEFNLEAYPKNIILRRVLIFEFSHSQGQKPKSLPVCYTSVFARETGHFAARAVGPLIADIVAKSLFEVSNENS